MKNSFIESVKNTIDNFGMLTPDCKVVCGYSGGADSTALLFVLKEFLPSDRIVACHVNHMIRGKEADRDEEHCRKKCERLGIPFVSFRVDVPALAAKEKTGIEEAARNARYSLLTSLAEKEGNAKIAVAHNSNDNAETVIFNLVRGASLKGLGGIPPIRDNIIRPLIEVTRKEIEDYLSELGEDYVTDSTNSDTAYSRNLIRNEVIPLLERIVPSATENISRASKLLREDNRCLEVLSKEDCCKEFTPLLSRRIIDEFSLLTSESLSSANISDCIDLIKKGKLWSSVSLPGNKKMVITRDGFAFEEDKDSTEPSSFRIAIKEGKNETPFGTVVLIKIDDCDTNIYNLSIRKTIRFDTIKGTLEARNRTEGDSILYHGHKKSLKKLLNEKKVSASDRKKLIIISDEDGILWIPGVAEKDRFANNSGDYILGLMPD